MRERQRLVLSKQHGASLSAEIIDDDADFAQRVRELKASAPDIGPVDVRLLSVTCNGCGASASLDYDQPRLPDGWVTSDAGEFCPGCLR
jgi:hypothetical protein